MTSYQERLVTHLDAVIAARCQAVLSLSPAQALNKGPRPAGAGSLLASEQPEEQAVSPTGAAIGGLARVSHPIPPNRHLSGIAICSFHMLSSTAD